MIWLATLAPLVSNLWAYCVVGAFIAHIFVQRRAGDSGRRLRTFGNGLARAHQELWLFALPGLVVNLIGHVQHGSTALAAIDLINIAGWWLWRNWPDDNVWKRRGRRVKDAVAERAGRLVVVPAGA